MSRKPTAPPSRRRWLPKWAGRSGDPAGVPRWRRRWCPGGRGGVRAVEVTSRDKRRVGRTERRRRTHGRPVCTAGAGRCGSGAGGCRGWAGPLPPQLRAAAGPHPWLPGHGAEGTQSVPAWGEWRRAGPRGSRRPGGRPQALQGPLYPFPPRAGRSPLGQRDHQATAHPRPRGIGVAPAPRSGALFPSTVKQPTGSFFPTLRGTPLKLAKSLKVKPPACLPVL